MDSLERNFMNNETGRIISQEMRKQICTTEQHKMRPNLIEIYASTNHTMRVNWEISYANTDEFCQNAENKAELIDGLKALIKTIEENYGN